MKTVSQLYVSYSLCKTIFNINTRMKQLTLFYLLYRHKELGPVYVLYLMNKALVVTTDPDHVKVIILFL